MILVECLAELQKKMTEIEKQHTVKIEKISSHIKALRVQKHIALNEFEKNMLGEKSPGTQEGGT